MYIQIYGAPNETSNGLVVYLTKYYIIHVFSKGK